MRADKGRSSREEGRESSLNHDEAVFISVVRRGRHEIRGQFDRSAAAVGT